VLVLRPWPGESILVPNSILCEERRDVWRVHDESAILCLLNSWLTARKQERKSSAIGEACDAHNTTKLRTNYISN
jgi:hypothetical protein